MSPFCSTSSSIRDKWVPCIHCLYLPLWTKCTVWHVWYITPCVLLYYSCTQGLGTHTVSVQGLHSSTLWLESSILELAPCPKKLYLCTKGLRHHQSKGYNPLHPGARKNWHQTQKISLIISLYHGIRAPIPYQCKGLYLSTPQPGSSVLELAPGPRNSICL